MLKLTPTKRVLFARSLRLWLLVLAGVFSFAIAYARIGGTVSADTSNTINFQARLQTSAGAIVPDGNYNVEFKLYDASSCSDGTGCTPLWTEDYLNSAGTGLQTINGYFSTALGSVTSFPSTIDWSQKLWLTMNIGGTTTTPETLVWDGEMNPRLQLTAVPYAFQADHANKADQLTNTTGSNDSVLSFEGSGSGHGNQTFVLPDQGAAGTYHLLTQEKANSSYLQLQTGTVSVQSGGLGVQTATIASDSTTALQVQNAAGTATAMSVDTTTSTVSVANFAATGTVSMADATFTGDLTVDGTANLANVAVSGSITVGSGGNGVSISAAGGVVASGTAQHSKTITLEPMYAGSMSGALDDTTCSTANSGALSNGYDDTTRDTYYSWNTDVGESDLQCTDVLVRVKLPSDFSSWASSGAVNIQAMTDSVANSALDVQVLNASGTADTNYNYTGQTLTTSWSNVATANLAGTYSAGDTIVLKLRVSSKLGATVKLGDITLTYKSSF